MAKGDEDGNWEPVWDDQPPHRDECDENWLRYARWCVETGEDLLDAFAVRTTRLQMWRVYVHTDLTGMWLYWVRPVGGKLRWFGDSDVPQDIADFMAYRDDALWMKESGEGQKAVICMEGIHTLEDLAHSVIVSLHHRCVMLECRVPLPPKQVSSAIKTAARNYLEAYGGTDETDD